MGKKGTFVEVNKLLVDSCMNKHAQIQNSRSKFEQCSGVCVGTWEFWLFRSNAMNAELVQKKRVVNSQISLNLLEITYKHP